MALNRSYSEFEIEQMKKREKEEEKAEKNRKERFIKRWVSSTPEEQAEIIYELINDTESARKVAARANFRHMRF